MKFKKGDIAWVHDSDAGWVRVENIKVRGNYYNVRLTDRLIAFGVAEHRLFTEKEYSQLSIIKEQDKSAPRPPLLH